MSNYPFVNVTGFTPNLGAWTSLANVASLTRQGNQFTLNMSSGTINVTGAGRPRKAAGKPRT